jgi:hypothetical protein
MAVTYTSALKQTRMEAVITAIDAGAGPGKLVIMTSGDVVLAEITLTDPCGTASGGVLTFDADPDIAATASGTGTAAKASLVTSADADVVTGLTVGTAATDVIVDSVAITSGQAVTFTAGTITHG